LKKKLVGKKKTEKKKEKKNTTAQIGTNVGAVRAEFVPKFHVALQASHAVLPMVILKISS
jgi:hypothetical protein